VDITTWEAMWWSFFPHSSPNIYYKALSKLMWWITHNVDNISYSPRNFATMLQGTKNSQLKMQKQSTPTLIHEGGWYEVICLFGSTITQVEVVILFMKLAFLSCFLSFLLRKKKLLLWTSTFLFSPIWCSKHESNVALSYLYGLLCGLQPSLMNAH
jgi:hypothetical protein